MNEEEMTLILEGRVDEEGNVYMGMDTCYFDLLPDCVEGIISMLIRANRVSGKKDYEIAQILEAVYKEAWICCDGQTDIVEEL